MAGTRPAMTMEGMENVQLTMTVVGLDVGQSGR
jgi:hypothetical protein